MGELAFAQRLDEGEALELERPLLLSRLQVVRTHQFFRCNPGERDFKFFRLRDHAVHVCGFQKRAVGGDLGSFTMSFIGLKEAQNHAAVGISDATLALLEALLP